MRILYHHRTLADGAEGVHIAAMVAAFRDLGHEVWMLGAAPSSAPPRRSFVERFRAVVPRGLFELLLVAYNVREYFQANRAIKRFRPDLVYKRHSRFDVAMLVAARRLGIPSALEVNCVFTSDGYERFEPHALPGLARAFERRSMALANIVIAVSSPLAREVRALSRANVIVLPNGADPDRFDPDRADGMRIRARHNLGARVIVGWVGILREWHGLDLLLDATAGRPDVTLLIVGDGPERPALEQRIARLGMQHRVVVTGRVRHEEMPDYIAAMDIAVVSDERTGVASPMKLLEYMAMARAVVAPRNDNITDLIADGVDGVLFPRGDAAALAAQLDRLAASRPLRTHLGAAARRKVERDRNWRSIAAEVLAAVSRTG